MEIKEQKISTEEIIERISKRLKDGDETLKKLLSDYLHSCSTEPPPKYDEVCTTQNVLFFHSGGSLNKQFFSSTFPLNCRISFRRVENEKLQCPLQLTVLGYRDNTARMMVEFSSEKMRDEFVQKHLSETLTWNINKDLKCICWIETTESCCLAWKWFWQIWKLDDEWNEKVTLFLNSCE